MARKIWLLFAITIVAPALGAAPGSKPATDSAFGVGTVFLPNPVADLGDQTLTDQKDADYPRCLLPITTWRSPTLTAPVFSSATGHRSSAKRAIVPTRRLTSSGITAMTTVSSR